MCNNNFSYKDLPLETIFHSRKCFDQVYIRTRSIQLKFSHHQRQYLVSLRFFKHIIINEFNIELHRGNDLLSNIFEL